MLSSFDFGIGALVFVSYILIDALYARYTLSVVKLNEWSAATTGVIIHAFLAFGVINYTQNFLYIIPLLLGSWVGTFFFVRRERANRDR